MSERKIDFNEAQRALDERMLSGFKNRKLQADKRRLDWLEAWDTKHGIGLYTRKAIDAAMDKIP